MGSAGSAAAAERRPGISAALCVPGVWNGCVSRAESCGISCLSDGAGGPG